MLLAKLENLDGPRGTVLDLRWTPKSGHEVAGISYVVGA
jgi:hypothetical protein